MSIKLNKILINGSNENDKVFGAINFDNSIKEKSSFIFSDPKGELFKLKKEILEKEGYRIEEINIGEEYNPLDLIVSSYEKGNFEEALTLCRDLMYTIYYRPNKGDLFFQESVMNLMNIIVFVVIDNVLKYVNILNGKKAKEEAKSEITLERVADVLIELDEETLDEYFNKLPNNFIKKEYLKNDFQNCKDKEYITRYALSELLEYRSSKKKIFINLNDITNKLINEKDDRPVAIFIKDLDNIPFSNALISIFIKQLYYVLSKNIYEYSGKSDRKVNFIIKNISEYPIKNLDIILSTSITKNIFFNIIIENINEINSVYGKDISDTILNNCKEKKI